MTPELTIHGDGLVEPFSNPGFPKICVVAPPPEATVSFRSAVLVILLPLPLTCIVYVPAAVDEAAVIDRDDEPEPGAAMVVGLNDVETPEGMPLAESVTDELNPLKGETLIVEIADPPAIMLRTAGFELMVKSGLPEEVVTARAKSSRTNEVL